jgi:hypothetical protein
LAANELAVASRQRTVSHLLFPKGTFDQNQHDCRPPPSLFFSVPRLKIKLEGRHFDTVEVMEAEPQAVLNGLTEFGFQDAFQNGRS